MLCVCGHWKDEHGYYDNHGEWISTDVCGECNCTEFDYDGGVSVGGVSLSSRTEDAT